MRRSLLSPALHQRFKLALHLLQAVNNIPRRVERNEPAEGAGAFPISPCRRVEPVPGHYFPFLLRARLAAFSRFLFFRLVFAG